jgi:hypothetical protein
LNAEYDLDEITCDKVVQELGEYEEEEAGQEQKEDGSVQNDGDDDDKDDEDNQKYASKPVMEQENRRSTRQRK